jgi:hypothetical protein
LNVIRLIHQRQARVQVVQDVHRLSSSRAQGLARQVDAFALEDVEDDEHRGAAPRGLSDTVARRARALLQTAKVDPAGLVSDHDLAIDEGGRWQRLRSSSQLRQPLSQISRVPTQQLNLPARTVPKHSAEAVKLRLVTPLLATR